jgi:hypothetical protein
MVTAEEIQQWVREHLSNHLGTYPLSIILFQTRLIFDLLHSS